MRRLALLLCAAICVSAQIFPLRPNTEVWKRLVTYLELSSAQLDAILESKRPYWVLADDRNDTRGALRAAIHAETARSPLRPEELGRLHVEWEMGRRRLLEVERLGTEAARKILTDTQLAKLKLLEELTAMRQTMDEAISTGLSPSDCVQTPINYVPATCAPPMFPLLNDIIDWGPRPSDNEGMIPGTIGLGDPLQAYFRFSESQLAAMQANAINSNRFSPISRMRAVVGEIVEELKRPVLDPMALGLRFAELESNRRQISEAEHRLVDANLALLDQAQKTKYTALIDAQRLRPLVETAVSRTILKSRCKELYVLELDRGFLLDGPFDFGLFFTYLGDCPDRRAL
jgi:hypothetical protein